MSYRKRNLWAAAIESSTGAHEIMEAPTAEFNIEVNPDVDEDGAPLEAVDANGEPTLDALETDIVEAEGEVEEAEEVVEKLEDTAEVLENYAVAIESHVRENGGLTQNEWKFIKIGLESRVKGVSQIMPSNESFGYNRLSATNEALTAIKQGIRKVWETIRDAIKALYNRIKTWLVKMFDGGEKMRKRADAIAEKSRSLGTLKENGERKIKLPDAHALTTGDAKVIQKGATLITGLEDVNTILTSKVSADAANEDAIIEKAAKTIALLKKDILDGLIASPDKIAQTIRSMNEEQKNNKSRAKNLKGKKAPAGTVEETVNMGNTFSKVIITTSADLLGGKVYIESDGIEAGSMFTFGKSNPTDVTRMFRLHSYHNRSYIANYLNRAKSVNTDATADILSDTEIRDVCSIVSNMGSTISDYKRGWENRDKATDRCLREIDSAIKEIKEDYRSDDDKQLEGITNNQAQTIFTAVLNTEKETIQNIAKDTAQIVQYALTTGKAALAYCTRSMEQYERN